MKTRQLGRTGLQVSEIGFGALEIGRAWGLPVEGDFAVPAEREVEALLDRVLALGVNLIDTAPAYMLSEERLGRILGLRRRQFYLASKCGEYFDGIQSRYDFSLSGTIRFIETSLRRLQTDYLDLVQIHCGPDEVGTIRRGETLEGMLRAKEEGKVRWVGVSCEAEGAAAALEMGSYDVLQLPYSMLNRAIQNEILPRAAKQGMGVIIREALEHGRLTGKAVRVDEDADPASKKVREFASRLKARGVKAPVSRLAIQFVLRSPHVSTVLVGTRNRAHLEEAVSAAGEPLDPKLLSEIDALEQ